jgi:hypothetical protein
MERILIKDSIGRKEIVLTDLSLTYDGEKISYQEIIDFNYSHSYFNGIGGAELIIKTHHRITSVSADLSTFIGRKKSQEKIGKVVSLYNKLYPVLMSAFIQNSIRKIQAGESVRVAKVNFDKKGISMSPRTSYWTTNISIPYYNADIKGQNMGVGLFGSHGNFIVLVLSDNSTGKSYKYSNKASHQPEIGQISKAEELLNHIKCNSSDLI